MSCYFENKSRGILNKYLYRNNKNMLLEFQKLTKLISICKISFFSAIFLEIMVAWFLIAYFPTSLMIAITIGSFLLTLFTYFSLIFYLKTKKPSQLTELKLRYISSCRQMVATPKGSVEHHLSIADALLKLNQYFSGTEKQYFSIGIFKSFFEKLSSFFHLDDVFSMQEALFFLAIEEHIKQIKNTPLDVEVHVSLANSYVLLAQLYLNISKKSFSKKAHTFQKKFETTSKRAIEEFIILKSFAPHDPWILSKLAQNYRLLGMLEQEALEYESLLELSDDLEIMFRLGKTYFELGHNAQGLQIYENLVNRGYKKARELLFYYSSTNSLEPSFHSL